MAQTIKKSVVVMGGGTGTHTILKGLKKYADDIDIAAVISMADSGGSTGRLRDEFGQLPVGDVRMALAALARDYDDHEELLRELFLYRFDRGNGLKGHNFGNLLLTALTEILGTEAEAVKAAAKLLRVQGTVLPVTADDVQLVATYDDGIMIKGEHAIDEPDISRKGHKIVTLVCEPMGIISSEAKEKLTEADLIVLGPGDLYSSLLANVVIGGVPEALQSSRGKLVYIANLMEKAGQTESMSIADCCNELCRYTGRYPDVVMINDADLPNEIVEYYLQSEGVRPVVDDSSELTSLIVKKDLITHEVIKQSTCDVLSRSLIRHDSDKLAAEVMELIE